MRGGDSLMSWISRLNGVIWNIRHSSSCIHSPTVRCPSSVFFVNRFRSADCQKIQLPLGGSQGEEAIRFYHSTSRSVPSDFGRLIAAPTVQVRKLVPFIQPHPLSFAFAQQLPQRGRRGRFAPGNCANRFLSGIDTGRVRKPMYWYRVRSVTAWRRCRPPLKNSQIRNWFYKIYCVLCGDTL